MKYIDHYRIFFFVIIYFQNIRPGLRLFREPAPLRISRAGQLRERHADHVRPDRGRPPQELLLQEIVVPSLQIPVTCPAQRAPGAGRSKGRRSQGFLQRQKGSTEIFFITVVDNRNNIFSRKAKDPLLLPRFHFYQILAIQGLFKGTLG